MAPWSAARALPSPSRSPRGSSWHKPYSLPGSDRHRADCRARYQLPVPRGMPATGRTGLGWSTDPPRPPLEAADRPRQSEPTPNGSAAIVRQTPARSAPWQMARSQAVNGTQGDRFRAALRTPAWLPSGSRRSCSRWSRQPARASRARQREDKSIATAPFRPVFPAVCSAPHPRPARQAVESRACQCA